MHPLIDSLNPPSPPPLPLSISGLALQDIERLANEHVDRWAGYVQECQPIAARLRGSFNARDDKLRQYFFRGKLEEATALYGEEVRAVAGV